MLRAPDLDRFHLAIDAIARLPHLGPRGDAVAGELRDKLKDHRAYICKYGEDMPEIRDWRWRPV